MFSAARPQEVKPSQIDISLDDINTMKSLVWDYYADDLNFHEIDGEFFITARTNFKRNYLVSILLNDLKLKVEKSHDCYMEIRVLDDESRDKLVLLKKAMIRTHLSMVKMWQAFVDISIEVKCTGERSSDFSLDDEAKRVELYNQLIEIFRFKAGESIVLKKDIFIDVKYGYMITSYLDQMAGIYRLSESERKRWIGRNWRNGGCASFA